LGSTGLLGTKVIDPPTVVLILIPAVIIAIYAFLIWVSVDFAEHGEKKADSVYYLGFLFTMVSLSHTLWLMGQEGQEFEVVIGNFGVALSSTIFSLAARIVLTQLVPPSDEEFLLSIEEKARMDLNETAKQLTQQLRSISGTLQKDSQAIYKSLRDTFIESSKDMAEGMRHNSNSLRKEADELALTLRRDTRTLSQSLQSTFNEIIQNLSQAMRESVDKVVKVSNITGERLEDSMEDFSKHLQTLLEMTDKVNATTEQKLNAVEAAWSSFQEMPSANEVLTKAVDSLSEPLERVVANTRELSQTFAAQKEHIEKGRSSTQAATKMLLQEMKENSRDVQKITKSLKGLQKHWELYSQQLPPSSDMRNHEED
jgi:uncharacterized protein (DUF2461 family)